MHALSFLDHVYPFPRPRPFWTCLASFHPHPPVHPSFTLPIVALLTHPSRLDLASMELCVWPHPPSSSDTTPLCPSFQPSLYLSLFNQLGFSGETQFHRFWSKAVHQTAIVWAVAAFLFREKTSFIGFLKESAQPRKTVLWLDILWIIQAVVIGATDRTLLLLWGQSLLELMMQCRGLKIALEAPKHPKSCRDFHKLNIADVIQYVAYDRGTLEIFIDRVLIEKKTRTFIWLYRCNLRV